MLNKAKAKEIIDIIVASTKYHAIINMGSGGEKLTRFANSEIHQNVEVEDFYVSVTLCEGKKSASANTNAIDADSLKKLVAGIEKMLAFAPDGEQEFIVTPPQQVREAKNDERLAKTFDIKGRADTLKRLFATLSPDFTASGALSLDANLSAYGDSAGNFHFSHFDAVDFSVVVTHKDGDTGYGAVVSNNCEGLAANIDAAFKKAYDKAVAAINPIYADLGAYTVVLEPAAVANLLMYALFGLNASGYQKGTSFASDKLGEKLFGDNFTVRDDVNNPATFQRYYDGEGYARQPLPLIEKGVLKNVLYCAKTAQKAGATPTGHAFGGNSGNGGYPLNVVMEGGDSSIEEMIAGVKRGILVTHFHYCNNVNPKTLQVTGLTRDGTFLIEDGKIVAPLKNMRFTQSLLDAFSNIKALSKEQYPVGLFGGPALLPAALIEDFHFTSGQK